uniref:Outer capsid protein VP4 n=2 Tax=Rotavirus B TaxID=28876 RepID=A0A2H4ZSX4_9REOV|nr:outer capsid spike protein [Rotavirus B]AUG45010.1 outer capsid spike protein [Rotavirus B]AUG45011.1 outer capsid spike protein [Rotavirus B]AUG45014.1 outer capsid spike protein [Rotavirus B]AUG45017.1 outer capsid spike protein [Rotavirus B]
MISYLRREWQSYGDTATVAGDWNDDSNKKERSKKDEKNKEKPVKIEDRYCYSSLQKKEKYEQKLKGFSLGTTDTHVDPVTLQLFSGEVTNGYMFINTNPPCQTIIRVKITSDGQTSIGGKLLTSFECYVTAIKMQNDSFIITYYSDVLDPAQKKLLTRCFSLTGCSGIVGGPVYSEVSIVDSYKGTQNTTSTTAELYTWEDACEATQDIQTMRIGEKTNVESKIIIYEQEDGFWKILTETLSITLKGYFKPYYTMGGAFKNWLVDSGFEKYELNYTYVRDGQEINATTLTYPKPTGKAGINQPWRPATDFNGQFTCLQPEDIFTIWYFEDRWQINNAIYAKNFQSDTMASGLLENKGDLKFRMNYIPSLAKIGNKPGKVEYRYLNGGFAQVDTSNYTGMALIFNFVCTGTKFYANDNNQPVNSRLNPYICFVGRNIYHDGHHYLKGCCTGFASGYDDVQISHDITVSYTVMKPSDPEFVTGGDQYGQSITAPLEISIRDLQDQINSIRAELNIQQVTSAVFTAITSLGDLPGLFSNVTKLFSKFKDMLSKIKNKKMKIKPVKGTMMIDKYSIDVPNVTIVNRMPEETELGIVYNSIRKANKHDFPAFALSTEIELPYIQTTSTLTPKFKQYLKERGLLSVDDAVIQFDAMNSTFSTLKKKNADIINYKIDPDIAHEVLSNMSTSATRSLFSLNVRKQISLRNEFNTPTYNQLIDRILDDGALLDVLGKLDRNSVSDLFQEFLDRMKDMLSFY